MLYNLIIFIGSLFALPRWLTQSKYKGTILERFGFKLPPSHQKASAVWIHMVSMGETKIMAPIYKRLRQHYPDSAIYLSNTTTTGRAEAKKSMPGAEGYFLLPLDFSWVMKKLVKIIRPNLLILSESDFWMNQIQSVKKSGAKIILLNGKISEKSAAQFRKFPRFSQKLFGSFDHLCIQSPEYATRFKELCPSAPITITGNMKLAIPTKKLTEEEKLAFRKTLGLAPTDRVITIGSTHENEEELILANLKTSMKVLIVPRHPERFAKVKKFIQDLQNPQLIVVDKMGVLTSCYQISEIALVGGSFVPGIGGHNIYEPIQANIPVIFGPYMETQKELVDLILNANAGIQTIAEKLPEALDKIQSLQANAHKLLGEGEEVLNKSWNLLELNYTA
jgi:3-deoxy-D-manno-octulosonic-acid transferase